MRLAYRPGSTPVHGLDARSKMAFQIGFAVAAFAWSDPRAPAVLTVVVAVAFLAARVDPRSVAGAYVLPFVLLGASVAFRAVRFGPPWIDLAAGTAAAIHVWRVALVLFVSAVYVRTTPVSETQAAIQRHVPGKVGQFLGMGTALVLRFLPVLERDLRTIRGAMQARLGDDRPIRERMRIVAAGGLRRAFARADRLALALQARCFAWNPTPPRLRFAPRDYAVGLAGVGLAALPVVPLVV
jgi:biotin transport system permease protein